MKNCVVANLANGKRGDNNLTTELKAQIENSLALGWDPDDLWVITNFPFEFMGIKAFHLPLNTTCLTGSKMFALRELFKAHMIDEVVWMHDLDAWQCVEIEQPTFADIGVASYSRPKFNGGSVFVRDTTADIIFKICDEIEIHKEQKEEPTLDKVLKSDEYRNRVTVLNSTWNVGCSGYVQRWYYADKPIRVVHFHPSNRIAWDTHTRNRNGISVDATIPDRLRQLMLKYYGDTINKFTYEGEPADPIMIRSIGVRGNTDLTKFAPK